MYVCLCNCVRDHDLRQAAASGVRSFEELQARTRVSTSCGTCETMAREVFDRALDPAAPAVQPA
jgi:bacterioferritin-associated ferredoxin